MSCNKYANAVVKSRHGHHYFAKLDRKDGFREKILTRIVGHLRGNSLL